MQVPQKIEDCVKPGSTVKKLWGWARIIRKAGSIIVGVLSLVFLFTTISEAKTLSDTLEYINAHSSSAVVTLKVFSDIFTYSVWLVVVYIVSRLVSLAFETAAKLLQNSDFRTNLLLYDRREELPKKKEEEYQGVHVRAVPKKAAPSDKRVVTADGVYEEIEYVDIACPVCGEHLSFEKGIETAVCPQCDTLLKV